MTQRVLARKPPGATFGRPAPSVVRQVVNSPGVALKAEARAFFEPRFGFDFSRVRVHADSPAAAAARSMDAAAYTVGQHIGFDSGRYEMHSTRGRGLIAHELAHTVQQSGAAPAGALRMASPADASEKEADRASSSPVLSRGSVAIRAHRSLSVQCQPNQTDAPHFDPAENASPIVAAALGSMTIDRFETGKSDIPAMHKAELARTVKYITTLLMKYPGSKIQIVGNTDAIGKDADNQSLGQSRADSVEQALIAAGIPAEAIQTESHGSSDLRVKTKTENPLNRRVEMHFQPARQFPSVMSSRLSLSGGPGPAPQPGLFPPPVSPQLLDPTKPRPPYQTPGGTPDFTKPVPSDIPKNLIDDKGYNDVYTSHGNRPDSGGDQTQTAQGIYGMYRKTWGLPESISKSFTNSGLSGAAGADQSRDYPNAMDRANQDWKNMNPGVTTYGPYNIPFKPFKWEF
jgi:outer membrane protein OmpA-like peptidoglycan-associated protein